MLNVIVEADGTATVKGIPLLKAGGKPRLDKTGAPKGVTDCGSLTVMVGEAHGLTVRVERYDRVR